MQGVWEATAADGEESPACSATMDAGEVVA